MRVVPPPSSISALCYSVLVYIIVSLGNDQEMERQIYYDLAHVPKHRERLKA